MKVILLADVYKHGVAGEVIDVSDGFARNWLLPKSLAKKATPGALRQAENLRAQAETRKAVLDQRLNELARQIDGVELFFGRRASPTGKLFGSVTTSEIAEALNEATGIDINRRRISQMSLREIGTHEVPIRLGNEISPMLRVTVVREEEFKAFMAQRAAALEAGETPEAAEEAAPDDGETLAEAETPVETVAVVAEAAVEAAPEAVVEPAVEAAPEAVAEAAVEAAPEVVAEAAVEAAPEAVTEAVADAVEPTQEMVTEGVTSDEGVTSEDAETPAE